jgi:hypothetical protein
MSRPCRKTRSRAKPATSIPPFLIKIYEILENPIHYDLISWNLEGNAFIIKNVTEFTEKVLPKYFKHNNFASFVRQLNLYDFHKSRYDNNGSEFFHRCFKRSERHLLAEIKRKMPNESPADSPSQFFYMQEDMGSDRMSQGSFQHSGGIQELINRQDQLENAVKVIYTQNKQLLKENKMLWNEVTNLKTKQGNTDKAQRVINSQNNQLLKENRYLWGELIMNREKYERQIEKLMVFLISIMRCSGNNPSTIFKKKGVSGTINNASEEDIQFDTNMSTNADNNFSVLPVMQITKQFANKKEEGMHNIFGNQSFVLEEKDLIVKLRSLLLDADAGNNNLHTIGFMSEKRPPLADQSFESEDGKDRMGISKFCKLENNLDSTMAIFREEINMKDKFELPKHYRADESNNDVRMSDMTLPIENGICDFEMAPINHKEHMHLGDHDFLPPPENFFSSFHPNAMGQNLYFEEDYEEDEEQEEEKVESFTLENTQSMHQDNNIGQFEFHGRSDSKLDEAFPWFSSSKHGMNNNNIMQYEGAPDHFFTQSGTL